MAKKEEEKARRLLQKFLALWKDADPNLPLLKEAQRLNIILQATGL